MKESKFILDSTMDVKFNYTSFALSTPQTAFKYLTRDTNFTIDATFDSKFAEEWDFKFLPTFKNSHPQWLTDKSFRDWKPLKKYLPRLDAVWIKKCPYRISPWDYVQGNTPIRELGHTHMWLQEVCLRDSSLLFDESGEQPSDVMYHEYAHVLSTARGHGKEWVDALKALGKEYINLVLPMMTNGKEVQEYYVRKRHESSQG